MNLVTIHLRSDRRSIIAWSAGLAAFTLLIGLVYASFDDPADLDALLENYPEELLEVFGGQTEAIGTVKGFLKVEMGAYLPLVLGIYAVMHLTRHFTGAEETGRLDHLLARPHTRGAYYWATVAAAAITVTTMLLAASLGGIIGFAPADIDGNDILDIIGTFLDFLPLAFFYVAVGALAGTINHRRSAANAMGIATVLVMFTLDVVARLNEDLDWMAWLTPHGLLGKSDLADGDPHLGYLAYCFGLAGLLLYLGAWRFDHKDLYA